MMLPIMPSELEFAGMLFHQLLEASEFHDLVQSDMYRVRSGFVHYALLACFLLHINGKFACLLHEPMHAIMLHGS